MPLPEQVPPQSKIFYWKIFFTAFSGLRGEPAVTIRSGLAGGNYRGEFSTGPAAAPAA